MIFTQRVKSVNSPKLLFLFKIIPLEMSKNNAFVTSTGAKHTHFSDDDEDKPKQKKEEPKYVEKAEVHSANSWEKADLGDGDRNSKFLRLMGASKKKHQGRFVIGDNSPHQKTDDASGKDLNSKLEKNFKESMDYRLSGGRGSHIGLGFHDADSATKAEGDGQVSGDKSLSSDADKGTSVEKEKKDENKEEKEECKDRKRHSDSKSAEDESGRKKLKFVKSSND